MRTEDFLALFPRRKQNGPGDFHVPCPGHDDNAKNPEKFSLHVTETPERILLKCFAGCSVDAILRALDLPASALFTNGTAPPGPPRARPPRSAPAAPVHDTHEPDEAPATLAAFAARKALPVALLEAEGWRDGPHGLLIPYRRRDGSPFRMRERRSLQPGSGFRWDGQRGAGVAPYGQHRLDDAADHGELWLVEGESDTVTAWAHGLACLGLPGADTGGCLEVEDLAGIAQLWLVQEPDRGGVDFLRTIRRRLRELEWRGQARIVQLPEKDLSAVHLAHPDDVRAILERAQAQAADLFTWHDPADPIPGPPAVQRRPPPEGFIAKYVEAACERTDAPVESHTLAAVVVMSALAGSRVRLPLAYRPDGVRLVMWGMNIVDSTSGRKTTVNEFGLDIIRQVLTEGAILPWKGSPEAFIQQLAGRDGLASVFARDEYSGLLAGMKRGGYTAGLAQDFIRCYDGLPITIARTAKMNRKTGLRVDDTDRVQDPYLVKLCAATRTSFIETATIDDVLDGLLARFVFTSGTSDERPMVSLTDAMEDHWRALVALARGFHERAQDVLRVTVPQDVLALEWELEKRLKAAALAAPRPDAARPAMKRLAEAVLKVAALLAIDHSDGGAAVITPRDFEAAAQLSEPWQHTALALISDLGRTRFQATCDAVLTTIRAHPDGISTRSIYRTHRGLRQREFEEVVGALETQGLVHHVKTPGGQQIGRPSIVYFPGPESGDQAA